MHKRLSSTEEFSKLTSETARGDWSDIDACTASIENKSLIAVIRDTINRFKDSDYPNLLSRVTDWALPATKPIDGNRAGGVKEPEPDGQAVVQKPQVEFISISSVNNAFDKAWLAEEADVDRYLEAMRKSLMAEISKGKRIQI